MVPEDVSLPTEIRYDESEKTPRAPYPSGYAYDRGCSTRLAQILPTSCKKPLWIMIFARGDFRVDELGIIPIPDSPEMILSDPMS